MCVIGGRSNNHCVWSPCGGYLKRLDTPADRRSRQWLAVCCVASSIAESGVPLA